MKLVKIKDDTEICYMIINNYNGKRTFKNKTINECLLDVDEDNMVFSRFSGEVIFEIEFKNKNELLEKIPEEFL